MDIELKDSDPTPLGVLIRFYRSLAFGNPTFLDVNVGLLVVEDANKPEILCMNHYRLVGM